MARTRAGFTHAATHRFDSWAGRRSCFPIPAIREFLRRLNLLMLEILHLELIRKHLRPALLGRLYRSAPAPASAPASAPLPPPPIPTRVRTRVPAGRLLACAFALVGCGNLPSSDVDAGDLLGVFEHDASIPDASSDASTKKDPRHKDAGPRPNLRLRRLLRSAKPSRARRPRELRRGRWAPRSRHQTHFWPPSCPGAEVLEWKDDAGAPRYACVIAPKGVETRAPLPS